MTELIGVLYAHGCVEGIKLAGVENVTVELGKACGTIIPTGGVGILILIIGLVGVAWIGFKCM